jgi:peptidyl-dipeptidase Dcp
VPPFAEIKEDHFLPAIEEGIRQHSKEIDVIAQNPEEPTFANTQEAMELSGQLLTRVSRVFLSI